MLMFCAIWQVLQDQNQHSIKCSTRTHRDRVRKKYTEHEHEENTNKVKSKAILWKTFLKRRQIQSGKQATVRSLKRGPFVSRFALSLARA